MELILTEIELKDNTLNDNTFNVFHDKTTGFFHAIENAEIPRKFNYKLKHSFEFISKKYKSEILEYCLGSVQKNDIVTLGDIFLHSKFIEKIRLFKDIVLVDEYKGFKKGKMFFINGKQYRIYGFDITENKVNVNAQRILKNGSISRKQPLLEIFDFSKINLENIK